MAGMVFQNGCAVIAHCGDAHAQFVERRLMALQLIQLHFAEGASAGRLVKQNHRAFRPQQTAQAVNLSILIRQAERGKPAAGGRAKIGGREGARGGKEKDRNLVHNIYYAREPAEGLAPARQRLLIMILVRG